MTGASGAWTRADLLRVAALLEERHGIGVRDEALPGWLEERLRRALGELSGRATPGASVFDSLVADPELTRELSRALRVGETRFYRDGAQWEALRRFVVPKLFEARQGAPLLALSAGCSTGEEAWTVALLLAEAAASIRAGARFRVVGVDSSDVALATARGGIYDAGSVEQVPRELAQRYFESRADGSVRVVPALAASVSFQRRDLSADGLPPGAFALVVCKNVLIYFGEQAQSRLVGDLLGALADDGVLVVARSEVPRLRAHGAAAVALAPGVVAFQRPR